MAQAYNYNRNSPEKLKLLANTMLTIVDAIVKGLGTPDKADVETYRKYLIDEKIANTDTSPGFTQVKPKPKSNRAAKRTTQKD